MIAASIACPFLLAPALCMEDDDPNKANIISTLIFMSGILTILQSTVGTRLPIVQGGSFAYLVPTLAILNLPQWKCPPPEVMSGLSPDEKFELWQVRIREIQGAIIFAALFEALFALTGMFTICKLFKPSLKYLNNIYHLDFFHLQRFFGFEFLRITVCIAEVRIFEKRQPGGNAKLKM